MIDKEYKNLTEDHFALLDRLATLAAGDLLEFNTGPRLAPEKVIRRLRLPPWITAYLRDGPRRSNSAARSRSGRERFCSPACLPHWSNGESGAANRSGNSTPLVENMLVLPG